MSIQDVIAAVDAALVTDGATGVNRLIPQAVVRIYWDVQLEHQAMPDMPLEWIAYRVVTGKTATQELNWWLEQGGLSDGTA